ncbi:hypothetical protein KFQ06_06860 [Serratia entomophila]|uniref:Uncharacterized protein n=1 Tax=Serratia entomophila TaxID=42906 RepID=A0ABY5CXC4_9GAMM|nr:hypothetical protein [Serratia entomophila]USV02229.1 hypothetical protein KFQ06_06860 [Serratia entomophila]
MTMFNSSANRAIQQLMPAIISINAQHNGYRRANSTTTANISPKANRPPNIVGNWKIM